ncbi:MAG TPA: hypothetical protein VG122_05365 [Gemmata sp.]|jgi:hypothetical protein|nr:hypothetical protein [Gemmata sp.]
MYASSSTSTRRLRGAFALIELFVVISIIASLIGLRLLAVRIAAIQHPQ